MEKILFLGGEPGTYEMIQYAKEQGVYTIVTDWFDLEHSRAKRAADEYWMISYADINRIEKKCRKEKVTAIMAASSEYATGVMIELCERLALPCFATKESFHYEKDKADFKKMCREVGVPVPKEYKLSNDLSKEEIERIEFPVAVKPVDQSGGKGITYCYNREDLIDAFGRVSEFSNNPKKVIEKMIEGKVFTVYYALAEGDVSLLCMQSELKSQTKDNTVSSCFASSTATHYVHEYVEQMNDKVIEVIKRCGCRENVAWIEVILDDEGKFYAIEFAQRLGQDLIPLEYSRIGEVDLLKWGVDSALGRKHSREDLPKGLEYPMKKYAYSYMLCCRKSGTVKEIVGVEKLQQHKNVDILLDICIGDKLQISGKEIGYIGFYTETLDEAYKLIEEINTSVLIRNEKNEDMLVPYATVERFKLEDL